MRKFDSAEKIELLKAHQRKPPVNVHAIAEKFGIEVAKENFSEHGGISGQLK